MSSIAEKYAGENHLFYQKAEDALRDLFRRAREDNELQYVFSLNSEFRGCQNAGWNTALEAQHAFDEYLEFIQNGELTKFKARVALAFYCHMSEASGLYETPKNMLRVIDGSGHNIWPFQDLVEVHRRTGSLIAPNANKVLRDLAGHAKTLDLHELAEVFRDAFDPDLRNGYAHADYIIWEDGIRLRHRNGGNPRVVEWSEFHCLFERGINIFDIMRKLIQECIQNYHPKKQLSGTWGDGRPSRASAIYDPTTGIFSIKETGP